MRRSHYAWPLRLLLGAALLLPLVSLARPQTNRTEAEVAAPDPASPYGMAGVMRWPDWGSFSRPADAMLDTGGSWVREDFVWGLIEPREGRHDWTATDRIVGALRERKLNILGIISYSVNWATPSKEDDSSRDAVSFYMPDLSKYYWFVRTLVTRYKGSVRHWEVWNEPNSDTFWKPKANAKEYAELLKTAFKAVKDADPDAKVLSGGMAGNAMPFLEEMVAAGAGDSFDILAIHPYAVPEDPAQGRVESRPEVHKMVEVELAKHRAFLQRHGWNRPIWVTEVGWPAGDWKLDEQTQADYLAQAYAQMLAGGLVERIFWYSFKDEAEGGPHSWGLTAWGGGNTDLGPRRPAFAAYATSAKLLAGARPQGRLQLGASTVVAGFETQGAWNRSFHPVGELRTTGEQKRSGSASGKLEYRFDGMSQAVDFAPPRPMELPGKPVEIGAWVRGDGSGNYLSAWLRDRDGELFKARFGAVTGPADGWRYYGTRIDNYYFAWERTGGSPSNGKVDYPVSFVSFRLENTPDEPPGSGAIYIDDLLSVEGPDASAVRFARAGGEVVDVLWAAHDTQVSLPTRSPRAQIVDRDGNARPLDARDGTLTVQVGSRPVYVVHAPVSGAGIGTGLGDRVQEPAGSGHAPAGICPAAGRTDARQSADNLYFPETGHNLSGPFRAYWETRGGLNLFGYPVTEEFSAPSSDGKEYRQQYFERARMEYHPENAPPNDVLLGLLGVWTTAGRTFPQGKPSLDGATYYPESGHNLRLFRDWWSRSGGLATFGYPISEELQEVNAADGKTYTVQYFERNRLEYHPENRDAGSEVLLGLLGVEYLSKQGCE